jgi:hypothetical protein
MLMGEHARRPPYTRRPRRAIHLGPAPTAAAPLWGPRAYTSPPARPPALALPQYPSQGLSFIHAPNLTPLAQVHGRSSSANVPASRGDIKCKVIFEIVRIFLTKRICPVA